MKASDQEYEDHVLDAVKRVDGGWEISHGGGLVFFCPDAGVTPHVGDTARFYGKGFGYTVRGLDIRGHEIFYRTPEQEAAQHHGIIPLTKGNSRPRLIQVDDLGLGLDPDPNRRVWAWISFCRMRPTPLSYLACTT